MGAQRVHSTRSQLPSPASAMATTSSGAASPDGRAARWPHPNNSPGTGHGSRPPRGCSTRSRDPLAGLPSLPADLQLCDVPGGRVRRLDERLRQAANRTAAVLSGLWEGGLVGVPSGACDAGSYQLASWASASQLQREVLFGLVERHRGFCPPRETPPGAEAFASLTRQPAGGAYGQAHEVLAPSGAPALPPRGAVRPAGIGETSIPEGGMLLQPEKIFPTLAFATRMRSSLFCCTSPWGTRRSGRSFPPITT